MIDQNIQPPKHGSHLNPVYLKLSVLFLFLYSLFTILSFLATESDRPMFWISSQNRLYYARGKCDDCRIFNDMKIPSSAIQRVEILICHYALGLIRKSNALYRIA